MASDGHKSVKTLPTLVFQKWAQKWATRFFDDFWHEKLSEKVSFFDQNPGNAHFLESKVGSEKCDNLGIF